MGFNAAGVEKDCCESNCIEHEQVVSDSDAPQFMHDKDDMLL